ncbi:MAG: glycosyltransferase [Bacteroidetes bacterium]|nr:glycosyltransferase [Bacteroidota bacterium]
MKIIVDCQPLAHNCIGFSTSKFIVACLGHLKQKMPEIDWLFITSPLTDNSKLIKAASLTNIISKKILPTRLGWLLWYRYQLPALAKKNKADLLITTGGIIASSATAQCAWAAGIVQNKQSSKSKSYYNLYKKKLKRTLSCAKVIFTVSQKNKMEAVQQYDVDANKIAVIKPFTTEGAKPPSWAERESTKTKFAAGKEYFMALMNHSDEGLIDLLKAFSQFKKRLQSNMQLVLAGEMLINHIRFTEKMESFKYRADVHVYNQVEENILIKLIAASYGLILPFYEEGAGVDVLHALQAHTALVLDANSPLREIAGNAAWYADFKNSGSLANQLVLLYKDEKIRSRTVEKGKAQAAQFNMQQSIDTLCGAILHVLK